MSNSFSGITDAPWQACPCSRFIAQGLPALPAGKLQQLPLVPRLDKEEIEGIALGVVADARAGVTALVLAQFDLRRVRRVGAHELPGSAGVPGLHNALGRGRHDMLLVLAETGTGQGAVLQGLSQRHNG